MQILKTGSEMALLFFYQYPVQIPVINPVF